MIDYGGGNLRSLLRALEFLGAQPKTVAHPDDFSGLTHLAFPGQGAFGDCMMNLRQRHLEEPLKEWLRADKPYFGICIGYQLLFETSEESPEVQGLGIFEGSVQRFPAQPELKVPHMGWNTAKPLNPESSIWKDLSEESYYYFVHSFFPNPKDSSIVASTTSYGQEFASSVQRSNIFATQFHPEKSQKTGLQLLKNFLEA